MIVDKGENAMGRQTCIALKLPTARVPSLSSYRCYIFDDRSVTSSMIVQSPTRSALAKLPVC